MGWTGETGRAHTIARKYMEQFEIHPASTLIYACGHPGMIEALKVETTAKGYAFTDEKFWV